MSTQQQQADDEVNDPSFAIAGHTTVATQDVDSPKNESTYGYGQKGLDIKRARSVVFSLMLMVYFVCDMNYIATVHSELVDLFYSDSEYLDHTGTIVTGNALVLLGCLLCLINAFIDAKVLGRVAGAALVLGTCISFGGSLVQGLYGVFQLYPCVSAILLGVDTAKSVFDDPRIRRGTNMVATMVVCGVLTVIWFVEYHQIVKCEEEVGYNTYECPEGPEYGLLAFGHLLMFLAAADFVMVSYFECSCSKMYSVRVAGLMGIGTVLVIFGLIMFSEENGVDDHAMGLLVGHAIFFLMNAAAQAYDVVNAQS